jgi:hypothetical protein
MYNTSTLPKPDYKKVFEYGDAMNGDIITVLEKNFPRAVEQTKEFARQFETGSRIASAKKVWEFLKSHITYLKDSHDAQQIKLPSRFIKDGTGDCKSYSLTAASLLANLGIPVSFRYGNYGSGTVPTHVYVVAKDENGHNIIVDGVWKYFNSEKIPNYKFDHPMNVYTLSDDVSGIGWFGSHFFKEVSRFYDKNIKENLKKIGLAIPRRAFRTYVALNVGGTATKISRTLKRDPASVKRMWEKVGGQFSKLNHSVEVGKKKHRILGVGYIKDEDIGIAPAAAAIIAAAAPILIAFAGILKKGEAPLPGENPNVSKGESTVDKILETATDAYNKVTGGKNVFNAADAVDTGKADPEPHKADDPQTGFEIKPIYLIGAAAVAIYFLFKKK